METWLDCYLQQSGSLLEVVIIGLGGIGCVLCEHLCRILAFSSPFTRIKIIKVILIDGDTYQFRNVERQNFDRIGNKAIVQAERLSNKFPRILFGAIPCFVGEKNSEKEIAVESVVKECRIIFLAPDNGKTRKLVNDRCAVLKNTVLISGGNDIVDGYAHVYLRKDGKDITPPLSYMNPSVAEPKDKSPAEMGCAELMESKPQLYLANLDVAQAMLILFYSLVTTPINKGLPFFRLFSDTLTGKRRVVINDKPFNH
jgi:molybdopterin/thiamine biosynthesis adenylyltransferase